MRRAIGLVAALTVVVGSAGCSSSTSSTAATGPGARLSAADRAQAVKQLSAAGQPFTAAQAGCVVDRAYPSLSASGQDKILSGQTQASLSPADQKVITTALGSCLDLPSVLKVALPTLTAGQSACMVSHLGASGVTPSKLLGQDPAALGALTAATTACAPSAATGSTAATSTTAGG